MCRLPAAQFYEPFSLNSEIVKREHGDARVARDGKPEHENETTPSLVAALIWRRRPLAGRDHAAIRLRGLKRRHPHPESSIPKHIAEEGFIYGLPIVMNYAVMYEFCVDKNSGQYKGAVQQILNEARVFTYKDTAIVTPNSDTPYSMLWLDLRAEPLVLSVPAVEKKRYYSVQLCDGNTFNYGYIGSRATGNRSRAITWWSVPTGRARRPRASRRCFAPPRSSRWSIFRTQLFNAGRHAERGEGAGRLQSRSRSRRICKQPAPPAAPTINFPTIDKDLVKTELFRVSRLRLAVRPGRPEEKEIRAKLARIGIGAGQDVRLQGPLASNTRPKLAWA